MGIGEAFIRTHATTKQVGCLLWPLSFRTKGYGQCWFHGKLMDAHRAMAIAAHGKPPSDRHHAAHSCGNRACVNPSHIRWATPSENEMDKRIHGTSQQGERNGSSKLKESQVAAIKTMQIYVSDAALAKMFSVDRKTLTAIRNGRTWRLVQPAHISANQTMRKAA